MNFLGGGIFRVGTNGVFAKFQLRTTGRMFTVIGFMLGGICIGFAFRNRCLPQIDKFTTVLIWMLLFLLGIEVGGNRKIIEGLATLGAEAFAITMAAVLGSCVAARLLWTWLCKRKKDTNV